ncbi:MAG: tetratricopeptide repeat protein [Eubacterium sp.]|nr:tetratricopeptide repeat protein [Eubacterium sp.]
MFDIWNILGIEETSDTDKLKMAYRAKLSEHNPEDDPEGFKALRRAYEEAVRRATETASFGVPEEEEETEGDLTDPQNSRDFKKALELLYRDFYRRIDPEEWKKLLSTGFAISLDTSGEALDTLLHFFSEHHFIPQYIYKLAADTYYIKDRRRELSESYPRDLIDYVINNAMFRDAVDYRLFSGPAEADYDGYLKRFFELDNAIKLLKIPEQEKMIEELSESPIKNPCFEMNICRSLIQRKKFDEALEIAERLMESLPENLSVIICRGDVSLAKGDCDEAESFYQKALMLDPEYFVTKLRICEVRMRLDKPVEAKEELTEIAKERPYDNYIRAMIKKCNEMIIEKNLVRLRDELSPSEEHRVKLDTGWAYYQSYDSAEVLKLLQSFEPLPDEVIEYNNLKGRACLIIEDADGALVCFERWMAELQNMEAQGLSDEESLKQLKRKPYVNYLIGAAFFIKKNYKEAEKYVDISLKADHDEIIVSKEMKCEILFWERRYSDCIDFCRELLLDEDNFVAEFYIARSLFELGNYQKALEASAKVRRIYPYSVLPYNLEMNLFIKVKQYDDAKLVIDGYNRLNPESILCDMMRAKILIQRDDDYEGALKLLQGIDITRPDSDIERKEEYYILLGECLENTNDFKNAEDSYKKAVTTDPDNREVHRRLGLVYRKMLRFPEAIAAYSRQIELAPRDTDYLFRAITYKILGDYKKAADDYDTVMRFTEPEGYVYTLAGENKLMMDKYKEAIELFKKGAEKADKALDRDRASHGLANAYRLNEEYSKAEEVLKELCNEAGDKPKAVFAYASLLKFLGRFKEAETAVGSLLYSSHKVDGKVYEELCDIKCKAGEIEAAEKLYKKAGSEGIDTAPLAFHLGQAYLDAKEFAKAEKYFIISSESRDFCAFSELAEAAAGQFGGKTRVRRYSDQYLKLSEGKDKPEVKIDTARLFRIDKDYDKAERLLREALHMTRCGGCNMSCCGEAYKELCKLYIVSKQRDKLPETLRLARRYMGYDAWIEGCIRKEMQ